MAGDAQLSDFPLPTPLTISGNNRAAGVACPDDKIFFDVPFEQKETTKAAGLRWDSTTRRWYTANVEIAKAFSASLENSVDAPAVAERYYFSVPFLQKESAKAMGMRFDGIRKLWSAPSLTMAIEAPRAFKSITK
jgi:hypothetical protein